MGQPLRWRNDILPDLRLSRRVADFVRSKVALAALGSLRKTKDSAQHAGPNTRVVSDAAMLVRYDFRSEQTACEKPKAKRLRPYDGQTLAYTAIVFLLFFDVLMGNSSRLLADGDPYWQVVVGEQILHTYSFPNVDEYSYTRAGAPWIAKEWLSQILFYIAYSKAGWFGVALLTATISALASSILFAWLCRRVEPIVALTMTTVTFSLGLANLLARPLIFFYLLLTVCACGLVDAVEKKRTPWWLVPLAAVWANLHASFPIALILAALFGAEAVAAAAPGERARTAARWGLVLLPAFAATGVTPYGYRPLLVSLNIVGAKEIDGIDEWRPIGFDQPGVYGAAFIAGSLAIVALARAGWTRAAPIVVCAALMVRHVRFFPLFAMVAAPALATPIARLFPRFARQPSAPSAAMRKAAAAALGAACLATVLILSFAPQPLPAPRVTPSAALEATRNNHVSGPVFNDYPLGGFLIFNGIKTFIDGRTELYLNGFLKKTWDTEASKSDTAFLSLLDEYHVTWALFEQGSPGADKLGRSKKWKEIYKDDDSSVFVRR